jgi:hypothetical protein
MTSTAHHLASAAHPNFSARRFGHMSPLFDCVALALLPSLIALLVSAAFIGHGHISSESLISVLNSMADVSSIPASAP